MFYFHRNLPSTVFDYKRDLFRGTAEAKKNPLAYLKLLKEINQRDHSYVSSKNNKPEPVPERILTNILFFEEKFEYLEIPDMEFQFEVSNERYRFYQNHCDEIRKSKKT